MNWKRHLPPANTRLIVSDGENVGIARYINDTQGKVWFFEGIAPFDVTMWMELPVPLSEPFQITS
jgi:hypothetical protein